MTIVNKSSFIAPEKGSCLFPLLANPDDYEACAWDLGGSSIDRLPYWLNLYRTHNAGLLEEAVAVEVHLGKGEDEAKLRADACLSAFMQHLDAIEKQPDVFGRLDIISLGEAREFFLRQHGFADPYLLIKQSETQTALALLPELLTELDGMHVEQQRIEVLVQGVFAGNIFDVGATETLELFRKGEIDFHSTRAKLKARPWLFDGLDAWCERLMCGESHKAAVMFVDNAGCDVLLGMLPLARDLLKRGTHVILTANTAPSLNDVTFEELVALVDEISTWDTSISQALSQSQLKIIPSGCSTPLIDLSRVSKELVDAVNEAEVDLVVIEGMGRAIESNFDAQLTCDSLKMAMVKDADVARGIGGQMYDLVMKYEVADS